MASPPRMTLQTQRVLALMLEDASGEQYGLKISQELSLPTGSIYPILARLEQAGWITSRWEDLDTATSNQRRRRKLYRLTSDGAERAKYVLADTRQQLTPRWGMTFVFEGFGEARP